MPSGESAFASLAKHYGFYWRKFKDRSWCPNCHSLLPKSEKMPDYLIATMPQLVEVKSSFGNGRWPFKESIRDTQRETLGERGGWLYLEMADGPRAYPGKTKSAYLIPWEIWLETEQDLLSRGISSLTRTTKRNQGTDELFTDFQLVWEKGEGWTIPRSHVFWSKLQNQIVDLAKMVSASGL